MAVVYGLTSQQKLPEPAKADLEGRFATLDGSGRQPVRKGEIVVNVRDYGVVGDGVADDTAALDAALLAVSSLPRVVLFFPAGKYVFHSLWVERDDITLRGQGWETVLAPTYLHTDNVQAIRVIGNNVAVRDLFVEAQNPYMSPQAGFNNYELLRIGGSGAEFKSGVLVENVKFYKGGGCNAYRTSDVVIRGCRYVGSHGNSFGSVDNVSDVLIQGNTGTDGNDDLVAVTCDGNVPGGTARVVVANNILARTDAKAVCTSGVASAVVSGNHCEDTRGPAIQVFQDTHFGLEGSRRVNITGNVVVRGGKWFGADTSKYMHTTPHEAPHGIHVSGPDVSVSSNSVFDSQGRGIQADQVVRFRVSGNTVDGAGQVGVNVGNPDLVDTSRNQDGVVTGNMVTRTVSGVSVGAASRVDVSGNRVSDFRGAAVGETRGIYYGNVADSTIHDNLVVNSDGGTYAVRARPDSVNPQTTLWNNTPVVPGAGGAEGNVLSLGRRVAFGSSAPVSGAWAQGDVVINQAPVSGGDPWAWVCRASGSPGAWSAQAPVNLMGNNNTWSGVQSFNNNVKLGANAGHTVGFYGSAGVAKQTGVPVTVEGVHAALVALGLISE